MLRLAIAALAVVTSIPAAAAEVPATGANVRSVTYAQGTYRQTGPRAWAEFDKAGKQTNAFVEDARDEWSVFLFDPARNVRVQIDLYRKKIRYTENGGSYADLYDVTGSAAAAGAAAATPAWMAARSAGRAKPTSAARRRHARSTAPGPANGTRGRVASPASVWCGSSIRGEIETNPPPPGGGVTRSVTEGADGHTLTVVPPPPPSGCACHLPLAGED
jgi:hypothetical protein